MRDPHPPVDSPSDDHPPRAFGASGSATMPQVAWSAPLQPLPDGDALADLAVERARRWVRAADAGRTRRERAARRRLARLLEDPAGLAVTMMLTDQVMRISNPAQAAGTLRVAASHSTRRALGARDHLGILALGRVSRAAPGAAVSMVHREIRAAARGVVLPAEPKPLERHLRSRQAQGVRLNINILGEAVLGEQEAQARLARVVEMIGRPGISQVSVKISAVASQLDVLDHDGSVRRIVERIAELYRAADACVPPRTVNLDMEEFRDLSLTVDSFRAALEDPGRAGASAGVALQAYLPDSHEVMADLIGWALRRRSAGGAPIKIRLVKGANLAMERVESTVHGWPPAPYPDKALVDASWLRLVDLAVRPEHADAIRVGIASHNLFDLAWAVELAQARGVPGQIEIEMLEGMADAEARAIGVDVGSILMYAPVTSREDFPSAVAYLVRRLDENTAPENYLRASFEITATSQAFEEQAWRFRESVPKRHEVPTRSIRHGSPPQLEPAQSAPESDAAPGTASRDTTFGNTVEMDVTRVEERSAIHAALSTQGLVPALIPCVVAGAEVVTGPAEAGLDPNDGGRAWYQCTVATDPMVEAAVAAARQAQPDWEARGAAARATILTAAAGVMFEQRHRTLAVMARDAGKTIAEGIPEVAEAIDFARFYARCSLELDPRSDHSSKGSGSQPIGVVVVVPPWNFPYAIPAGGVLAALAAGNAVILKPAPETRANAWVLAEQLWAAGVPRDVLTFLPTRDDDTGRLLISHPGVDAVVLTGSLQTARTFLSWRPDLRLLAETSGKNAMVISATADIEAAVRDLVHSAFSHAGQKCSAASLAIVVGSVHDNPMFARQLRDAVSSLRVGPATIPGSAVGPLIGPPQSDLRRALTGLEPGESWLVRPECLDPAGFLWRPGVKLGVQPGSWSHLTEWFGPVLGVMRAPDLPTAIEWQNATGFGLTAGLQALDVDECEQWLEAVEAGNLYVNRPTTGAVVNRQPFGGWKRSAVGPTAKTGGPNYVRCLRDWDPISGSLDEARLERWWTTGSAVVDRAGLAAERNLFRMRPLPGPVLVRVARGTSDAQVEAVRRLSEVTGAAVELSSPVPRVGAVVEPASAIARRLGGLGRVRWLSDEDPGDLQVLAVDAGIGFDARPIAADPQVEGPRWLHEQSVTITAHRYGNVGYGPTPEVPGAG